jgi:hypothetical protein
MDDPINSSIIKNKVTSNVFIQQNSKWKSEHIVLPNKMKENCENDSVDNSLINIASL